MLVLFSEVANHEQHMHYPAVESLFFLVLDDFKRLTCILKGSLSQMLHRALEHRTKEAVEGDKLAHLHLLRLTGYRIGDVDN